MRRPLRQTLYVTLGIAWAASVSFGGWKLWGYDGTPGTPARAPLTLPGELAVPQKSALPTLVLLLHPKCPCSRATVGELERLMTECNGKLNAQVLMIRPPNVPPGWERTDLWRRAEAIPGVKVIADEDCKATRQFGATTSGQALLYAADGRLLYSGGITESRGHSGDSAGHSAILAFVLGANSVPPAHPVSAPVYGCPLFANSENRPTEGATSCRK